jgi:hypothetical protein
MNLMDSILYKIKNNYKGKLDCEEQRTKMHSWGCATIKMGGEDVSLIYTSKVVISY